MAKGYLAMVLHAHLPFVRHPEHDDCLEENWLFETLIETYIPLLMRLEELAVRKIGFKLTLSLSPTLAAMLADSLLQYRFLRRLERLIDFSAREVARTRKDVTLHPLALFYQRRLLTIHAVYERWHRDLLGLLAYLGRQGHIEFLATAATHGYLPLLMENEGAVRAQIAVGIETYNGIAGTLSTDCSSAIPGARDTASFPSVALAPSLALATLPPSGRSTGFWLPECGYAGDLDRLLAAENISYCVLETHGITRAMPSPAAGVYEPILSPAGVSFFGRDPESSRQVWSAAEGYPADGQYREFYRDIAYELDADYLAPLLHPLGIRHDSGFKYHRITNHQTEQKDRYHPGRAQEKAFMHARDFVTKKIRQAESLSAQMDQPPIIVAPFDAELFGHWWFEGPDWLGQVMEMVASEPAIEAVTLGEFLDRHPARHVADPCESSWGGQGFHETWLNDKTDWLYPLLHDCAGTLSEVLCRTGRPSAIPGVRDTSPVLGGASGESLMKRACRQALRELLLAQASDWPFMISRATTGHYGGTRVREHTSRLRDLVAAITTGQIDEMRLAAIECRDNIFPDLNYGIFCEK